MQHSVEYHAVEWGYRVPIEQPQQPSDATLWSMTLRRALPGDMPFIIEQERKFRELGFVGGDDARTHERQLSDTDCLYLIIEVEGATAGVHDGP